MLIRYSVEGMKGCKLQDLQRILEIYNACRLGLNKQGLTQWAHGYPYAEMVEADVLAGDIYGLQTKGKWVAVIVLNQSAKSRYDGLKWSCTGCNPVEVHRLAVDPTFQRRGIARQLMREAEQWAVAQGHCCIRLDSWSLNAGNDQFYRSLGYHPTREELHWPPVEAPFWCYEKVLTAAR